MLQENLKKTRSGFHEVANSCSLYTIEHNETWKRHHLPYIQRQESSSQLSTFPWSICNGLAEKTLSQLPQTESSNKQEGKGITQ
jgi:hypothetical protein